MEVNFIVLRQEFGRRQWRAIGRGTRGGRRQPRFASEAGGRIFWKIFSA